MEAGNNATLNLEGNFKFIGNNAYRFGGAIYSSSVGSSSINIMSEDGGEIIFKDNHANGGTVGNSRSSAGGAIYSSSTTGDSTVILGLRDYSGVDDTRGVNIIFDGNKTVSTSTPGYYGGGAIFSLVTSAKTASVTLNAGTGNIIFSDNSTAPGGYGAAMSVLATPYPDSTGGAFNGIGNALVELNVSDNGNIVFLNNFARYQGGGIEISALTGTINFNGGDNSNIIFFGNKTSTYNGGAIYMLARALGETDIQVGAGGNIIFDNNSSGGGGAIYMTTQDTDLNIAAGAGGNIIFKNNTAGITTSTGTKAGGAIYILSNNNSKLNIEAGDKGTINFSGNRASEVGGAIYNGSNASAHLAVETLLTAGNDGNIFFFNNTSGSFGGAISLNGESRADVIINGGDNSNIIFSNNSSNNTSTTAHYGGNIHVNSSLGTSTSASLVFESGDNSNLILTKNTSKSSGGVAVVYGNGIQSLLSVTMGENSYGLVAGNTAVTNGNFAYVSGRDLKLTFDIGANSIFDMRDNIYAMNANVSGANSIAVTKDGTGTWKVGGTNTFTGYSAAKTSTITTNINEGTLYLYRAGAAVTGANNVAAGQIIYKNMTADSSFNIKSGATIFSGGGNTIDVDDGKIIIEANAIFAFDLGRASTSTASAMLKLNSTNLIGWGSSIKIDVLSLHKTAGEYALMRAPILGTVVIPGRTLTLRGENLANTRANGMLEIQTSLATGPLYLNFKAKQTGNLQSYDLTWSGNTNGLWNATTDGNWIGGATKFLHGDKVTFNKAGTNDITINAGGVQVADMTVTGSTYNFVGGGITADNAAGTSFTNATGKLTITGANTVVDFSGITAENSFLGGIDLTSGTLRVGSITQLGTTLNNFKFGSADAKLILGTLPNADGASYVFDGQGTILQRIFMSEGGSFINIALEENVSAYFINNVIATTYPPYGGGGGGAMLAENITLEGSDYSTFAFINNSSIGNGGAINTRNDLSVSAGNYSKIIFDGNSADVGGAISAANFIGGSSSVDFSVLDNSYIIFSDNKGDSQGGALALTNALMTITAGNNSGIIFESNYLPSDSISTNAGGAIYAVGNMGGSISTLISVEDNSNILFFNNRAIGSVDGRGGAIFTASFSDNTELSLLAGDNSNIIFSKNIANGSEVSAGGAILSEGKAGANLTLSTGANGKIIFTDNMISRASEYGFGGAVNIALSGTGSSYMNINGGDNSLVLFRGNKYDVDMTDIENPVGGIANAIYFDNSEEDWRGNQIEVSATLNLNSGAGGKILFYDPITAIADSSRRVTVNINENGSTDSAIIFDGIDYYDQDDINRYYDMITDTTVFKGTLGLANNAIYGRIDESSTFELKEGTSLLSMRNLGVADANITNIINADVLTADSNIIFMNAISDTYNRLRMNSLTGTGNILLGFNSDTTAGDVIEISGNVNGSYDVGGFGLGNATQSVISDVIMVDGDLKGTFGGKISVGFFNYRPVLNDDGNWDLVRKDFNDASDITVIGLATLSTNWFAQLDNLTHRLGQVRVDDHTAYKENELWIRGFGSQIQTKFNLANNINFKGMQYGTDFGYDIIAKNNENSRLLFGLFGGYSRADNTFDDVNESNGYTNSLYGGLYSTWVANSGLYIDVVAKAQNFRTTMNLPENDGLKFNNMAFGASIEVGAPIKIGNGFFIEPRLQAAIMHMAEKEFTLTHGFDVNIDAMNIYHFVGAVKLGQNVTIGDNNRELCYYLSAGLEDEISDGGKFRITDSVLNVDPDGVRTVLGAGLTYRHTANTQLYFDFETSFGEKYKRPFAFSGGYKIQF